MKMVSGLKILILDGHHRYTASNMMREKDGIDHTMMMLMKGATGLFSFCRGTGRLRNFSQDNLEKRIRERFSIEWEVKVKKSSFESQQRNSEYDVKLGMYDGKKLKIIRAIEKEVRELSEKQGEIVGLDLIVLHDWLIIQ